MAVPSKTYELENTWTEFAQGAQGSPSGWVASFRSSSPSAASGTYYGSFYVPAGSGIKYCRGVDNLAGINEGETFWMGARMYLPVGWYNLAGSHFIRTIAVDNLNPGVVDSGFSRLGLWCSEQSWYVYRWKDNVWPPTTLVSFGFRRFNEGQWYDIEFGFTPHRTGGSASTQAWVDGVQVGSTVTSANWPSDGAFPITRFRVGIGDASQTSQGLTIYFDRAYLDTFRRSSSGPPPPPPPPEPVACPNLLESGTSTVTPITSLAAASNTATVDTRATGSVSPTGGRLQLLGLLSRKGSSTAPSVPNTPTTAGWTWTLVGSSVYDTAGVTRARLDVWRAVAPSSPGSVTATFTWPATVDGQAWQWLELGLTDTSDPIRGSASVANGAGTVGLVEVPVAGGPNNAYVAFMAHQAAEDVTACPGNTKLANTTVADGESLQGAGLAVLYRLGQLRYLSASYTTSSDFGLVAVEIRAATDTTPPDVPTPAVSVRGRAWPYETAGHVRPVRRP